MPDPNLYKGLGLDEVAKIEDLVRKFKGQSETEHTTNKTVFGRPFIQSLDENVLTRRLRSKVSRVDPRLTISNTFKAKNATEPGSSILKSTKPSPRLLSNAVTKNQTPVA